MNQVARTHVCWGAGGAAGFPSHSCPAVWAWSPGDIAGRNCDPRAALVPRFGRGQEGRVPLGQAVLTQAGIAGVVAVADTVGEFPSRVVRPKLRQNVAFWEGKFRGSRRSRRIRQQYPRVCFTHGRWLIQQRKGRVLRAHHACVCAQLDTKVTHTNPKRQRGFRQRSPRLRFGLVSGVRNPSVNALAYYPQLVAKRTTVCFTEKSEVACRRFVRDADPARPGRAFQSGPVPRCPGPSAFLMSLLIPFRE